MSDPAAIARLMRSRAQSGLWIGARGSSMGGDLGRAERVRVVAVDRRPRIGEVWAFVNASGDVIAHRYVRPTRIGRLVFAGDAAVAADDPIPAEWVIGVVVEAGDGRRTWPVRRRGALLALARLVGRRTWRHLSGGSRRSR